MNFNFPEHSISIEIQELFYHVIGGDWGKDVNYIDDDYGLAYCIRGSEFKRWEEDRGITASLRKIKLRNIASRKLETGDILLEISGGGPEQPVGRTVLIDSAAMAHNPDAPKICTNFLRLVRPTKLVNPKYLNLFLQFFYKSGDISKYQGGSNNLRNLKFEDYRTIKMPLVSVQEQGRIVAKIEELFSSLDKGKEYLKAAQAQLRVYKQVVLKWAFEGKLTNEHVNDLELANGWRKVRLKEISKITGGVTKGKNYKEKPTITLPYLSVANVQDGYLDLRKVKTIDVIPTEKEKYRLDYGDVLYTEGGDRDKLGRGTIWKNEIEGCIHQNHIYRARPNFELVNSKYLALYSQSKAARKYFFDNAQQTTNLASINLTILSNLLVTLPPLTSQDSIVSEIESRISVCDKLTETIGESLQQAEALRQSILKRAFEGKLVPQNPADEPVSALLARIRAERDETNPKKKEKTKTKTRKV